MRKIAYREVGTIPRREVRRVPIYSQREYEHAISREYNKDLAKTALSLLYSFIFAIGGFSLLSGLERLAK